MEFRSINWSFEVSLEDLMIYALGDKGVFCMIINPFWHWSGSLSGRFARAEYLLVV